MTTRLDRSGEVSRECDALPSPPPPPPPPPPPFGGDAAVAGRAVESCEAVLAKNEAGALVLGVTIVVVVVVVAIAPGTESVLLGSTGVCASASASLAVSTT